MLEARRKARAEQSRSDYESVATKSINETTERAARAISARLQNASSALNSRIEEAEISINESAEKAERRVTEHIDRVLSSISDKPDRNVEIDRVLRRIELLAGGMPKAEEIRALINGLIGDRKTSWTFEIKRDQNGFIKTIEAR